MDLYNGRPRSVGIEKKIKYLEEELGEPLHDIIYEEGCREEFYQKSSRLLLNQVKGSLVGFLYLATTAITAGILNHYGLQKVSDYVFPAGIVLSLLKLCLVETKGKVARTAQNIYLETQYKDHAWNIKINSSVSHIEERFWFKNIDLHNQQQPLYLL